MKNKVIIVVIAIMLIVMIPYSAFARMDTSGVTIGTSGAEYSSKAMTERILGIVQVIGSVISVVGLIIIGIRYMLGSLEEKANMKGVMIYYIVGCVLVFATSNILSIVYNLMNNLSA